MAEQPPQGMEYTTLSRLVSSLVLARTKSCNFCPEAYAMRMPASNKTFVMASTSFVYGMTKYSPFTVFSLNCSC